MSEQFTVPEKPLAEMSADELFALKRGWYAQAREAGHLGSIERVCRELGNSLSVRYGPKYELCIEDVYIYVDGYGRYMTVSVDDPEADERVRVCSTHPADGLFVPGEWLRKVEPYYESAHCSERERKSRREDENRRKLLEQLGG